MRIVTLLALGASALTFSSAANATLVGSLGGGTTPFLSLSTAGLEGGTVATLTGGTVYTADQPFADMPAGSVFENSFLAAGPRAGQPATLSFTSPTDYVSFLWGSPDTYNRLTLTTNLQSYTFTANSLGFTTTDGNQSVSQYVQFLGTAGETISSLSFDNDPATDAFETANFSVTQVPEPASWAMMVGGFGLIGAALRRRQQVRLTYA